MRGNEGFLFNFYHHHFKRKRRGEMDARGVKKEKAYLPEM